MDTKSISEKLAHQDTERLMESEEALKKLKLSSTSPQEESWEKKARQEIINILTPPKPPEARFKGGVKDWEYHFNKTGLDYLVNELLNLLTCAREEGRRDGVEYSFKEISLVIKVWCGELGIEQDWPDDLHPADVLDDYVFPYLTAKSIKSKSK